MSLNLVFDVEGGGTVAFPFQTPTSLTFDVLNAETKEEQLELVEKEIRQWGQGEQWVTNKMNEVRVLLENPNLSVSMI